MDRQPRVGILADDLIWASRLAAAAEQAGAEPVRLTGRDALVEALEGPFRPVALLVDLAGRRFDPLDGIWVAAEAGLPVLAVGQHEDLDLRHRSLAAGASAWISYNAFFRRGPDRVRALLSGEGAPLLPDEVEA